MKTILAIILFAIAFKASGATPVKRPAEVPVIPVLPALPEDAAASDDQAHQAQMNAEKFLLQAEAYLDCRVMNRRQHQALVAQLDAFSGKPSEEV